VRAYYPGEDWYVTGVNQDDAGDKLSDEVHRLMQDPVYIAKHLTLAKQHLNGEAVTPGFEVNTISQEDYQQRTEKLGDRLRRLDD
jgi:hypothetical protein